MKALVSALAFAASVTAVGATGASMSTDRVVSPSVVASWRSHDGAADGKETTLLVLWRGTPGWHVKGGVAGGGSSSGGGRSYAYQYMSRGGFTFTMEFDDERHVARLLNQEISLKDTNVVLVDFVDSKAGPTIVGYRWVEPGAPAPPVVPGGASDPIAGAIRRSPELLEYLQCDLKMPDAIMQPLMEQVCHIIRGEPFTWPGLSPR